MVDEVGENLHKVQQNTLKMETYFVRCFGGEMELTDDVDFDAFGLKQNFR